MAYLTESAEQGNQYAQYALGKLYLTGQDVKQDRERAWAYFYESAEQGNEYADFFLEHFDQTRRPNVFLSATRLLHHLSQIFRDNSVPPRRPGRTAGGPKAAEENPGKEDRHGPQAGRS